MPALSAAYAARKRARSAHEAAPTPETRAALAAAQEAVDAAEAAWRTGQSSVAHSWAQEPTRTEVTEDGFPAHTVTETTEECRSCRGSGLSDRARRLAAAALPNQVAHDAQGETCPDCDGRGHVDVGPRRATYGADE